ncbi:MAG: hypothetical protein RI885_1276 [Actinomycetota bacterium]|jgi:SAM-dependent methyltransferase
MNGDDRRSWWDSRYAEAADGQSSVWSLGPNAWVAETVAKLTPGAAIDLACGEGRNALWLAERGWEVTAVDFSAVGLASGRARAEQLGLDVDWVQADATTWVSPQLVDLVVIAYLQLPTADLAAAIRASAAALAPGGTLALVGHDLDNLLRGVGGPQDPEVLHSVEDVRHAASALDIVTAGQVRRPVGDAFAIDTVLVARRPVA